MELWQLNILVVLLIAIFTRKDMAVIASAVMLIGLLVGLGDYTQAQESLYYCGLNSLFTVLAVSYNKLKQCHLSLFTAICAALATTANLIQMYDPTALSSIITGLIGWFLASALLFMDGDKGMVNGFLGDLRATTGRIVYSLIHYNNNKGHH